MPSHGSCGSPAHRGVGVDHLIPRRSDRNQFVLARQCTCSMASRKSREYLVVHVALSSASATPSSISPSPLDC
jgi:hypothetical protein